MKNRYSMMAFVEFLLIILIFVAVPGIKNSDAATLDVCKVGCTFSHVADALNAAENGDTVRIAQGTYRESQITIMDKEISLEGGWNADFSGQVLNPGSSVIVGGFDIEFVNRTGTLNFTNMSIQGPSDYGINVMASADTSSTVSINLNGVRISGEKNAGLDVFVRGRQPVSIDLVNCIIDSNGRGIYLSNNKQIGQPENFTLNLTNSTVVLNTSGGLLIDGANSAVINSILWGNIAYTSSTLLSTTYLPNTGGDIILGTDAHASVGFSLYKVLVNNASTNNFINNGSNLTGANIDPLFRNLNEKDFRLSANSPCIDAGTLQGAPADDFEGDTRPIGRGVDIGAYEYDPCLDDTVPPAPVSNLNMAVFPLNIVLNWQAPDDNPYDYISLFNISDDGNQTFLSRLATGQDSLELNNQFWGKSLHIRAITYDKCGNAGVPVDTQVDIPLYRPLYCPAGAFNFSDLSSSIHLINISNNQNNYFVYGFGANGTREWEQNRTLPARTSETISSFGGLSASIYTTEPAVAFVEMNGINGTSGTFPCSLDANNTLFLPENVCSEDWWSGILIFNPASSAAQVNFVPDTGTAASYSGNYTVPAMGSLVITPPCDALSGKFYSSLPVTSMQIVGNQVNTGTDIGTMLLPANTSDAFYLTDINDGIESWTGFAIYNPAEGNSTVSVMATKFLSDSMQSSQPVILSSIAPSSRKAFNLSEPGICGIKVGLGDGNNQPVASAGMLLQSSLNGFDLLNPNFMGVKTGIVAGFDENADNKIYFFNPGNHELTVSYNIYDFHGNVLIAKSFNLLPGQSFNMVWHGTEVKDYAFLEFSAPETIYGLFEKETQNYLDLLPFLKSN